MSTERNTYLAVASRIGARLCRDAIWSLSRCNWLGPDKDPHYGITERACGPSFYSGTSGIALFLAQLYAATGESIFRTTAIGAFNHAWSKREEIAPQARLAFYSGWLGLVHVRLALGESLWQEDTCEPALELVESLARSEPASFAPDVIMGSAGAIPVLLALHRRFARPQLLDLAVRQGEDLLARARNREEGLSWRTLETSSHDDLTGLSHGAAGIAWALLELYRLTGEERWRSAAEAGFRYEGRWFNDREANWADLRDFGQAAVARDPAPFYSVAWCHGAPGIALSRLRAWEILGEGGWRREAEVALGATARSLEPQAPSPWDNFSLCHGQAGNAEVLLYASQVLDPGYFQIAEAVARRGIEFCHTPRAPWPCGVPGASESPSFMLGLAGIGYFYLRMLDPDKTPPMLMIHPR